MVLIKIIGMFLIFMVFTMWGILKSFALKKRNEKLSLAVKNLGEIASYIRLAPVEKIALSEKCIDKKLAFIKDGEITVNKDYLDKNDISSLEEFFAKFGTTDKISEIERCELYKKILQTRLTEAENSSRENGKLYATLGILGGLAVCIFLV